MITDEQIEKMVSDIAIHTKLKEHTPFSAVANALESYEQSKWIRFDPDDESTWPENKTKVYAYPHGFRSHFERENSHGLFWAFIAEKDGRDIELELLRNVTHWQPLPEPPKC